ncbi:hypothetical protein PFISCL1PPCAC_20109, partial [Pristionchus fissidentatus]
SISSTISMEVPFNEELMQSEDMESVEKWTNEKAGVHVVTLSNGKKINIKFYFDQEKLSMCDTVVIDRLDDLLFFFRRSHNKPIKTTVTFLDLSYGEHRFHYVSGNSEFARFRVGPFLSHISGETTVIGQGKIINRAPPDYSIRINVGIEDGKYNEIVLENVDD